MTHTSDVIEQPLRGKAVGGNPEASPVSGTPDPRNQSSRRRLRRAGALSFLAAVGALMLAPSLVQAVSVGVPSWLKLTMSGSENRKLADPPTAPGSFSELLALPGRTDAYLNDHFGLRSTLIGLNNRIRYALFGTLSSGQLTPGKNGTVYFNSHGANSPLYMIRHLCGQGVTPAWTADAAAKAGAFLERAVAVNPQSSLLLVPTKPVLYPENLPDWLQAQCGAGSPLPAIMTALSRHPLGDHAYYPFDAMMAMKPSVELYPKTNFHWAGEAPRRLAEQIAEQRFGLPRRFELPTVETRMPSDIQHFAPGVPLRITIRVPDYAAAGVTACTGHTCFPELGDIPVTLADVSRYRAPAGAQGGPKLLLISDSFGAGIAGAFSEYFGEVWHLSTNDIARLTPEQRQRLTDTVFGAYAPDRVLYVYHDFAAGYFTTYTRKLLDPKAS